MHPSSLSHDVPVSPISIAISEMIQAGLGDRIHDGAFPWE